MDLQAIEARLEAATQGPWDVETIPETGESRVVVRSNTGDSMLDVSVATHGVRAEDAEFIAHAPEDIRALIEEVETLRGQVEAVRAATANHPDPCEKHPDGDTVTCGWKSAYQDVVHALEAA